MGGFVLALAEVSEAHLPRVGAKAYNLSRLARIPDVRVPPAFCITTEAYDLVVAQNPKVQTLIGRLHSQPSRAKQTAGELRTLIESLVIPDHVCTEISEALQALGTQDTYAVRSSATAEDAPDASFAGQHDTYLNVSGPSQVIQHIPKCWASLFTERALSYRNEKRIGHTEISMCVVIQHMLTPLVSGVMFTADPLTHDRKTISIDAVYGLGEPLVAGLVEPDTYKVRGQKIVSRRIGAKSFKVGAISGGGTVRHDVEYHERSRQALSDEQILALSVHGTSIASQFGSPQDIEWCLEAGEFYIVQARPVTTLFPAPKSKDGFKRVYISSGHMQVMTDPILPLGMSVFELASQFTLDRAGGRHFVDITEDIARPTGRRVVLQKVSNMDPLMTSAVKQVMQRMDYLRAIPRGKGNLSSSIRWMPWLIQAYKMYRANDPRIIDERVSFFEQELRELEREMDELTGTDVVDYIIRDRPRLQAMLFDATWFGAVLLCQYVSGWLRKNVPTRRNVLAALSKSIDRNITSEMGLALCEVADVVRRHPRVVEYFASRPEDDMMQRLREMEADEVVSAIDRFLAKYGSRCTAEIDLTRPRWREDPSQLVPAILSNLRVLSPGEHRTRFEHGKCEAAAIIESIVTEAKKSPRGEGRARKLRRMLSLFRNFTGVREYPKYFWMRRNDIYKKALVRMANTLQADGVIQERTDAYYLYLEELREAIAKRCVDHERIRARKEQYAQYELMMPPRVIFSDGEVPPAEYDTSHIPEGALSGIAVSAGVVEGRAVVALSLDEVSLEPGDILVTAFTDPSWCPVFLSVAGLVTEVGGMMSHGAVITREYGLPAVASVPDATSLIITGQRIRLDGTNGYVQILGER